MKKLLWILITLSIASVAWGSTHNASTDVSADSSAKQHISQGNTRCAPQCRPFCDC